MSWSEVPSKMAQYRAMEYGGDVEADKVIQNALGDVLDNDASSLATVPLIMRDKLEADLDYRIGACTELSKSKAWSPNMLRQV